MRSEMMFMNKSLGQILNNLYEICKSCRQSHLDNLQVCNLHQNLITQLLYISIIGTLDIFYT